MVSISDAFNALQENQQYAVFALPFGIVASSILLYKRNELFPTSTAFGKLLVALAVLDLLQEIICVVSLIAQDWGSLIYLQIIPNDHFFVYQNFVFISGFLYDIAYLTPFYLVTCIIMIAYYVICKNGIFNRVHWLVILFASSVVPLIYSIYFDLYCNYGMLYLLPGLNFYDVQTKQNIASAIIEISPSIIIFIFAVLSRIQLQKNLEFVPLGKFEGKELRYNAVDIQMINIIEAITFTNLLVSLPDVVLAGISANVDLHDSLIDEAWFQGLYNLQAITSSTKGFWHLAAIYISKYLTRHKAKESSLNSATLENGPTMPTIEWQTTQKELA